MDADAAGLAPPCPRRFLWCSAGGRTLHGRLRQGPAPRLGWLARLLGRRASGVTIYEFEAVERGQALAALAAHLEAPGVFAIETAEGARIDLLASRASPTLTLDGWFFEREEGVDTLTLGRAQAEALIGALFELTSDREVARLIRTLAEHGARAAA